MSAHIDPAALERVLASGSDSSFLRLSPAGPGAS